METTNVIDRFLAFKNTNNYDTTTTSNKTNGNNNTTSIFTYDDEKIEDPNSKKEIVIEETADDTLWTRIMGFWKDMFDGKSKDQTIKETQQHRTGDCWLLSAVNALSYTEKGREAIKNALDYKEGYTLVNLKGYGIVRVDDKEVQTTKGCNQYSSGDDDMIILELAVEKVRDEMARGETILDPDIPIFWVNSELSETEYQKSSTANGVENELWYLLLGNCGTYKNNKDEIKQELKKFEKDNNQNISLCFRFKEDCTVEDIDGKSINLYDNHTYSIKKVEGEVVTIINPWNSGDEINISQDTLINNISFLTEIDLSRDTEQINCISKTKVGPYAGDRTFEFADNYGTHKYISYDKDNKIKSRTEIKPAQIDINLYDENGKITGKTKSDFYYKITKQETYCAENTFFEAELLPDGSYEIKIPNVYKDVIYNITEEQLQMINDNKLYDYQNLSAYDIYNLSELDSISFKKAIEYLESNPDVDINDVKSYIKNN